ncbi:MAG: hypothetical protein ACP5QK_08415 [Myxococcota bacterium]
MNQNRYSLELAYCGLFGALALLMPVIFHVIRLGHIFMPMYLPLIALAFYVKPLSAALTSLIVPLLSSLATGMPPIYPPIAIFMSIELSIMTALISILYHRFPKSNEWIFLVPILLLGRAMYVGLVYLFSIFMKLPAKFLAGVSFLSGWPGLILILLIVPAVVRLTRR